MGVGGRWGWGWEGPIYMDLHYERCTSVRWRVSGRSRQSKDFTEGLKGPQSMILSYKGSSWPSNIGCQSYQASRYWSSPVHQSPRGSTLPSELFISTGVVDLEHWEPHVAPGCPHQGQGQHSGRHFVPWQQIHHMDRAFATLSGDGDDLQDLWQAKD